MARQGGVSLIDFHKVWEYTIIALFATAGGLARLLSKKDTQQTKLYIVLSELFISGFAGILVVTVAQALNVPDVWYGPVGGVAGWLGSRGIEALGTKLEKIIEQFKFGEKGV